MRVLVVGDSGTGGQIPALFEALIYEYEIALEGEHFDDIDLVIAFPAAGPILSVALRAGVPVAQVSRDGRIRGPGARFFRLSDQ